MPCPYKCRRTTRLPRRPEALLAMTINVVLTGSENISYLDL
jgi:hypothetical protein